MIAGFTLTHAWQLLVVIIIVHAVLLAPVVVAIMTAIGERAENQRIKREIRRF